MEPSGTHSYRSLSEGAQTRLGALPPQCGSHHDCSLLSQDAATLRTAFQLLNSKLDSELRPEQSLARLS